MTLFNFKIKIIKRQNKIINKINKLFKNKIYNLKKAK
jgi:hypothetical protein